MEFLMTCNASSRKLPVQLISAAVWCLLSGCSPKSDYDQLTWLSKHDPAKADEIAQRLSQTTNGVLLAIHNLELNGGPNRGYNRSILLRSSLTNVVFPELTRAAVDSQI